MMSSFSIHAFFLYLPFIICLYIYTKVYVVSISSISDGNRYVVVMMIIVIE